MGCSASKLDAGSAFSVKDGHDIVTGNGNEFRIEESNGRRKSLKCFDMKLEEYESGPIDTNKTSATAIDVLDLPYSLIRRIFSYLSDQDLYFNVRKVCRQLRGYVEDYVHIGIKVFITGGGDVETKKAVDSSEFIILFQRENKITSMFSTLHPGYPGIRLPKTEGFGGLCDNRILVGYGRNIFEYKPKEKLWTNHFVNLNCKIDVELGIGLDSHLEGCLINDSRLLLCWETQVHLIQCNKMRNESTNELTAGNTSSLRLRSQIRQKSARSLSPSSQNSLTSVVCLTRLPVTANGDTITNIGQNKVIFIGSYWVFEGELTTGGNDVTWKTLEFPKVPRRCHMAFKMKDSVYIVGGYEQIDQEFNELSSCERYDLTTESWEECPHSLPYPLVCASAVVNQEENLGVIIGGFYRHEGAHVESSSIITFTETDGFKIFEHGKLHSPRSSCHTSIRIL